MKSSILCDEQYARDLAELQEICREYELPGVHGEIELGVYDLRTGECVFQHTAPMHSWVRNLYNIYTCWYCSLNATGTGTFGNSHLNFKDTGGTIRGNVSRQIRVVSTGGGIGETDYGLLVGTGSTAWSFEDYEIDTLIEHSAASGDSGKLYYYSTEAPDTNDAYWDWDSGARTLQVDIYRFMNNYSGASITVNEIGLVGICEVGNDDYYALLARDLVSPGVSVGDYNQLRTRYRLTTVAFPS